MSIHQHFQKDYINVNGKYEFPLKKKKVTRPHDFM